MFQLAELWILKKSLGIRNILLYRCDQRIETIEVLLGPEVSDDANFKYASVEIATKIVKNVRFLQR